MDLRGGNLIVKKIGGQWHVMIADWGSSSALGAKTKFRGTPAYAHNSWFPDNGKKRKVAPGFDLASLGYTIVTALGGCRWKDRFIDIKKIATEEKKLRTECCNTILKKRNIVWNDKILKEMDFTGVTRGSAAAAAPPAHDAQPKQRSKGKTKKRKRNPNTGKQKVEVLAGDGR